jgi:cytochrome c oxidase subunit 3
MSPDATVDVHHPAALAHQFDSLEQQRDASTLGMWVFLATEVLFFGVLFATYAIYRAWYADAFAAASHELLIWAGTINTVVLITSSLTMALGVHATQTGDRRRLMRFLAVTMILGTTFLGIKAYEYYTGSSRATAGAGFRFEPAHFQHAQIFFSLYYIMTGLHALHMMWGLASWP